MQHQELSSGDSESSGSEPEIYELSTDSDEIGFNDTNPITDDISTDSDDSFNHSTMFQKKNPPRNKLTKSLKIDEDMIIERIKSPDLLYKHPNPDVEVKHVCDYTVYADIIVFFEDAQVCIPLHKAQLAANLNFFKQLFSKNWQQQTQKTPTEIHTL